MNRGAVRHTAGVLMTRQKVRDSGFSGTKPPVLTKTKPATQLRTGDRQPRGGKPTHRIPDQRRTRQPKAVDDVFEHVSEQWRTGLDGGVDRFRIAVPRPVHRDGAVAPGQRVDDRVEVVPVVQGRMQQQNRWATA